MSHVTCVILISQEDDNSDAIDDLNRWLAEHRTGPLTRVDEFTKGPKAMECRVDAGGLNYLDVDAFVDAVIAAPWHFPENVQLLLREQRAALFAERVRAGEQWAP